MTLGELKIETLKKMFLNSKPIEIQELENYKNDKKYATYLNMFNQALNEGLLICMRRGREIIKSYEIKGSSDTLFNLKDLISNFYKIYKVLIDGRETSLYHMETDYILCLDIRKTPQTIVIIYEAYPELVTDDTEDDDEIDSPIENLMILPLYIASQLYKDDDIAQATMYRNEFESQVDNKHRRDNNKKFESINGWF